MNKFLSFAFIPAVLIFVYRFFLASHYGTEWSDYGPIEGKFYLACGVLFALSFWHLLVRNRCPECRAVSPHFLRRDEVDRFVGSKKVNGTDGKGRSTTSHVSVTYAKMHTRFRCANRNCEHVWVRASKHEVN